MVRRGRHEGSISKRADGRWEARLTLLDGSRKSFYARTRKEVAARLRDALTDLAKGVPVAPEKLTVAQFLARWLADMASQVDKSTHLRYGDQVRRYLAPALGTKLLARLEAREVQAFYTSLSNDRHLAPKTVRLAHTALHGALEHALRLNLVAFNVSERVLLPPATSREMEPFDEDQANLFLDSCAGHQDEALFALAITTGMRQGELIGLHWQDIDWEHCELTVNTAVQEIRVNGKKAYRLAEPKTAHSRRKIALSRRALLALVAHRARQEAGRRQIGADWQDHQGLVFPDALGDLQTPQRIYFQFKQLLKKAGLPDRRFHDLRHTAATILLLRGVYVQLVSQMLGHKDIALTLRVYGHLLPHTHEQAAAMMDEVFAVKSVPVRSSGQISGQNGENGTQTQENPT